MEQDNSAGKQKDNKFPVIKCLPRSDFIGGMTFWCPFCNKWHNHGQGDGHRVAHCLGSDSPYKKRGYIIKMMAPEELKEARKAIDAYLEYLKMSEEFSETSQQS